MNELPIQFSRDLTAGNVKAAMKAAGAKSSDLWQVPRAMLRVMPGFNARINTPDYQEYVQQLADQMVRHGYDQAEPLAGYVSDEDGNLVIYVTDGHSRLSARDIAVTNGAAIDRLPVRIKPQGTTLRELTISLATSNNGRHLTPVELGIVCQRLTTDGMSEKEIAVELHITPQYVSGLLRLIAGPVDLLQQVIHDRMSAAAAIEILRRHGNDAVDVAHEAERQAKENGKERITPKIIRQAEQKVAKPKPPHTDAAKPLRPTEVVSAITLPRQADYVAPAPTPKESAPSVQITDAMRYEHLMRSIDVAVVIGETEYTSRTDIDAEIDKRIRATSALPTNTKSALNCAEATQ